MGEWFSDKDIDGIPLTVSRTGWSSELGYELNIKVLSIGLLKQPLLKNHSMTLKINYLKPNNKSI